jgi:methionyl-tRNA formyltransferase
VECLKPARIADVADRLADVDCVVVVAYGGLVPAGMLDTPQHGYLNVHYSLLPAWRGAAPVQHAILHGDETTGVTVFRLDAGLDTGPVLGSVATDVGTDTAGQLLDRLAGLGAHLLLRVLGSLEEGVAVAVPQPADGVSLAPKVTTSDAGVVWTHPAFAVERRIRAVTPAPGAWTMAGADRLKVEPVVMRPDVTGLAPGHAAVIGGEVLVGTATHAVQLTRVLRPGKNWAPADSRLDKVVMS